MTISTVKSKIDKVLMFFLENIRNFTNRFEVFVKFKKNKHLHTHGQHNECLSHFSYSLAIKFKGTKFVESFSAHH
jgi:hypothetical protein